MAKYTVKLAKRAALLRLNNEATMIRLNNGKELLTEPGLINGEYVRAGQYHELVNLNEITYVQMPLSRFTPDQMCFMEVDWNE